MKAWIEYPVTVEEKMNAPWMDDVTWRMWISLMEHNNDGEKIYIRILDGNWKQRLYNRRRSFSNPWLRNQTALSRYF